MSRYKQFDLGRIKRVAVTSRTTKVSTANLARPVQNDNLAEYLEALPDFLAAADLKQLVSRILKARESGKPILWGFGGHVIKVGLTPVLIDLLDLGFITGLATNGSGVIHDFELAFSGSTSEDVEQELKTGSFGMAEETGRILNQAVCAGAEEGLGLGETIGRTLETLTLSFPENSLALGAYRRQIPLTVHLAIGTDTTHGHPEASGAALGATSHTDFRIFTQLVSDLSDGGVFLNIGSAVVIPEVFLKAVSTVRSSGIRLENFTTANFDFIQHYRPTVNVVKRPVSDPSDGMAFTGHHEIMIPLLAALLKHPGRTGV